MAFIETPRFPDCVSFGAVGGAGFFTTVVTVESGHELRNRNREKALGRWEVSHDYMRPDEYEPLRSMFYAAAGRANGFRFRDHTDYTVISSESAFVTLSPTTKQLAKLYTFGSSTYTRLIQKPDPDSVSFTGGSSLSLDYTTGILTHATAPTAWAGRFDVPARFDTDIMEAESMMRNKEGLLLISWRSIVIQEIRV